MIPRQTSLQSLKDSEVIETERALKNALQPLGFRSRSMLEADVAKARSIPCTPEIAREAAIILLGCYPTRPIAEAEQYISAMFYVFMEYSAAEVAHIVNPAYGLPSTCKFFPSVADVSCALRDMRQVVESNRKEAWPDTKRPGGTDSIADPRPPTLQERKAAVIRKLGYDPAKGSIRQPWCFDPAKPPPNAPWHDKEELMASAKRIAAATGLVEFDAL